MRGFGLQRGALGSTVAHDAHNVVVVGTNDADCWDIALSGSVRDRAVKNPYRLGTPLVWCSTNDVIALATQAMLYEQMTGDAQFHELATEARGAWQKAEIAKWWPMIKAANVKVE